MSYMEKEMKDFTEEFKNEKVNIKIENEVANTKENRFADMLTVLQTYFLKSV